MIITEPAILNTQQKFTLYVQIRIDVTSEHILQHEVKVFSSRGSAVERQSLASVLSPSFARPVADG